MHLYNVSKSCGWLTSSPRVAGLPEQDFVVLAMLHYIMCVCFLNYKLFLDAVFSSFVDNE